MTKVPISRQIYSIERLAKMSASAMRKEGVRESEAAMLQADATAALATLRLVQTHEDAFRAIILASRKEAT